MNTSSNESKNREPIILLLIMAFGASIFLILKQFDADKVLVTLFLISLISLFAGFCCWFFIGRAEGGKFEIFNIEVSAITGSFFIFLLVFSVGVLFFNPKQSVEVPVTIYDEKVIKALTKFSGLDMKIIVKDSTNRAVLNLNSFFDISRYLTLINSSPANKVPQDFSFTLSLPDSLCHSNSKVELHVNEFLYQKLIDPHSVTASLTLIDDWTEISDGGHYFTRPAKSNLDVSMTLYK